MIHFSNLAKSYGDRTLFEGFSTRLDAGHCYGLVGANGSGKTTLLNILAGDDTPSDGEVIMPSKTRVGVLKQDRYLSDQQRIVDVAMMGDREVWEALAHKEKLLAEDTVQAAAIAEAEDRIQAGDGYTLESRSSAMLEGLGIPSAKHYEPLSILSGGFKLRVLLAQTLVGRPDLLLLDEPTNHLDILTIDWLEDFIRRYAGCALVISHDHRFLNNVVTRILDVDYGTVTQYPGNYDAFVLAKQATRERKEQEISRQQQIIAEKKAFVERFRAKATKARQAQSRAKQIEKIEVEELAQSSRRAPLFRFEQHRKSGKEVLTLAGIDKAYGDKVVLKDISLEVRRGERIAIIGANGLGKSTLLKIASENLAADEGEVTWGYETNVGYFAQDHRDLLTNPKTTVLDYLWDYCPQEATSFVRGQLGRLLFSGEEVDKRVGSLSGGEAARLIFSRLIVQKANVLLLDEPTNHLDLEAIEALAEALQDYPGTMLFVSHNRWFVSSLATRVIELTASGVHDFAGTYEEYLARQGADHLNAEAVLQQANAERRLARGEAKAGEGDWAEQKKQRAHQRKLLSQRDRITAAIEEAEARQAAIQESYCRPGFFENTPAAEVEALQQEEQALGPKLEGMLEEWEGLETEIERLGLE